VIGDDDDIRRVVNTVLFQAGDQVPESRVDVAQCCIDLGRIRAVIVTGVIDLLKVQGQEVRAFVARQAKPRQHLIHARVGTHLAIECQPVLGTHAVDGDIRARPEHCRRMFALAFGANPQRLAAPPRRIGRGLWIIVYKFVATDRIEEAVVDDAVMIRIQAGDDGVVIRERERGEGRAQRFGVHTIGGQQRKIRREFALDIICAVAVDRNQDERRVSVLRTPQPLGSAGGDGKNQQRYGDAEEDFHGRERKSDRLLSPRFLAPASP